MTVTPQQIGAALRRTREKRGWSLGDLAAKLDVDRSTVSRVERGLLTISAVRFIEWCSVLGLSVSVQENPR